MIADQKNRAWIEMNETGQRGKIEGLLTSSALLFQPAGERKKEINHGDCT
jgi:hypothetical protein